MNTPPRSVLHNARLATNPPTHQHVAFEAYRLAKSTLKDEFGLWIANVIDGAKHEDEEGLPGDLVIPFYGPLPFISHYWNPYKPDIRFCGRETCIERLYRRWGKAMDFYKGGQLGNAYDQLGHVAHLLTDMSVPAHVHWDLHPIYDTYEMGYLTEFNDRLPSKYNYQQWTGDGLEIPTNIALEDLFSDLAKVAYEFDSNDAAGRSPQHTLGHSGKREHQPKDSNLFVWYDVSYDDAHVHAETCMPACISSVARLYQIFSNTP